MKPLYGIVVSLLTFLAGCGTLELTSHWRAHEVLIDGKNTEWRDSLTALDDKLTSVGLQNDAEYLYIGLITGNRDLQRQIMREGITFWFDRDGGKAKTFGIHYPLRPERSGPSGGGRTEESGREPDSWAGNMSSPAGELELYGPKEEDHHRMTIAETGGIEVRAGFDNSLLVYELKVPLVENEHHPFAVGAKPATLLGVGVETGGSASVERPPERMGGNPEGRAGGRGGRPRGGESGGRSAPRSQQEPLKIWATVQLAARDSSLH